MCDFSSNDTTVATVEALCIQHATGVGVGSTSLLGTATGIPGPRCGEQTLLTSCSVRVFDFTITMNPADGVRPQGAGFPDTATITVQTNPPTANQTVKLSAMAVANSGHHFFHSGTRPTGSFGAIQGTTDANGTFQTSYTAPIFGGTMTIQATMGSRSNQQFLEIFVPGLFELGSGTNYVLTGSLSWHPSNHFGTLTATTNLPLIADDYKTQFYGSGIIPDADKLKYNDMSLINGGKFDIDADPTIPPNWTNSSHGEHRVGINCDVGSSNVPVARWADLNRIFFNRGVTSVGDETATRNHWHLSF